MYLSNIKLIFFHNFVIKNTNKFQMQLIKTLSFNNKISYLCYQ